MASIQLVEAAAPVGRKWRRPKHPFQLRTRPYQIQPFFIAPVVPGETVKNVLLQSRVVSDPVKNPLLGAWKEYYFFYVKLRDMARSGDWTAMLMNPEYVLTPGQTNATVASTELYTAVGGMRYVEYALAACVREYFRDEGDAGTNLGALPQAYAFSKGDGWFDSLTRDSEMPVMDPNDTDATVLEKQQLTWEIMRQNKLTNMSFEEFLRTFGVHGVDESMRPELVRYVREFTYPANTVEPSTGVPSSAFSWSIQERADKDRYIKEHGFIFGVTVMRPKVYMSKQVGNVSAFLAHAFHWMPVALRGNPEATLHEFAEGAGPVPSFDDPATTSPDVSKGYWLDMKDLFLYGDQYVNFALNSTDGGFVNLPTSTGGVRYVASADIDALFRDAGKNLVREDGIVTLSVLGTATETT